MEPFIGTIQYFGFNFAPRGWAVCDGQQLPIQQYQILFALIGTSYGGDGVTTFGLPDLRGRVSVGQGTGPGLSRRTIGERGGAEAVTLTNAQLPAHNHGIAAAGTASSKAPNGNLPAVSAGGVSYGPNAATSMSTSMVQPVGGNQPHDNMQPYLVGNWCIALEGIFPSRN